MPSSPSIAFCWYLIYSFQKIEHPRHPPKQIFTLDRSPNSMPRSHRATYVIIVYLSAGVNHIATDNLIGLHQVKDTLKLAQAHRLERCLDQTPCVKVESLLCVLAVAHVATLDLDHAHNGLKHGRGDEGIAWQADAAHDTARAHICGGLLEGLLGDGEQDSGVGTQAVGGGGLDVGNQVLGGEEVDVSGRAQLGAGLALVVTTVDGDGVDAHGLAVLQRHVAETATGTSNGDPLACAHARLLDALVDSDTGAQHGRDGLEVDAVRDAGNVSGLGHGILLEGAVDGVARQSGFSAKGFVGSHAVGAGQTRAVDPLDADMLTKLDVVDELATLDDDTGTLVAADEGQLDGDGPVAHHGVEVGVADTRELDVDENLIGAGLGHGDLLVDDGWRDMLI